MPNLSSDPKRELHESREPNAVPTPPAFNVPFGACDSHAHIFAPFYRCPLDPQRTFNPPKAGIDDYRRMLKALGLTRAVIVHSAVYGMDLSVTSDALLSSNGAWRGIALVNREVTEAKLRDLHAVGFRGVRLNYLFGQANNDPDVEEIARRVAAVNWHIQLLIDVRYLPDILPLLRRLPVTVVIDHMGRMPTSAGRTNAGFQALLKLLRERRCWCKLSGANRMGDPGPPYSSVIPFARELVDTAADRLVWGTDWPHVRETGIIPNDGDLLNLLGDWVPDENTRNAILCDNPARLYGFLSASQTKEG